MHHHNFKRYRHAERGELELYCKTPVDAEQCQKLPVFTATPGSPSHQKLQLLAAVGG